MFVLGIYGIMVMGIGIIISGIFILKKNPNARAVAAWIAFTALAYAIGKTSIICYVVVLTGILIYRYVYFNVFRMSNHEHHRTAI